MSYCGRNEDAREMSQKLDLGGYVAAFWLWFECERQPPPEILTGTGRCCYQGCCTATEGKGMVQMCKNGHVMHPECFRADLQEKLEFKERTYSCYQCDDRTLDTLYRSLVCNSDLKNVLPFGLTTAGASVFAATQAIAVGSSEYAKFMKQRRKKTTT